MGSTRSERRDLLELVARSMADAHHRAAFPVTHLVSFVELRGDELHGGVRAFEEHPCEVLVPAEVEQSWWALVLCSRGTAHLLDEPDGCARPIVSTFARSRDGDEVSLLRRGDELTTLPGWATGRIPDLLRSLLPAHESGRS
jgi:hypothetical protein